MKKLIVLLTILWFVGWGYWFLYERGHILTDSNEGRSNNPALNISSDVKSTNSKSVSDSTNQQTDGHSTLPKPRTFKERIDSLIQTLDQDQVIQLICYYNKNENYQGKHTNKGIERSMRLLDSIDQKYIDSLIYPVGLATTPANDSIDLDRYYQLIVFNKEQPLLEINDERFFIFFPYASDSEVAASKIEEIIDSLSKIWHDKSYTYEVTGHTDDQATESTNYLLGVNRAKSIQQKLANTGIPKEDIKIISKGENEPIASNLNPEGRYLNRRAEIVLHNKN